MDTDRAAREVIILLSQSRNDEIMLECVELCDKFLEAGRDRQVEYIRSLVKLALGEKEAALADAKALVRGFPNFPIGYKLLFVVFNRLGLHAEADEAMRRSKLV